MINNNERILNSALAQTVRRLRNKRELSQEELALLASVDRTYISGIERARRNITVATLERLIPHLTDSTMEFFQELCNDLEAKSGHAEDHPNMIKVINALR